MIGYRRESGVKVLARKAKTLKWTEFTSGHLSQMRGPRCRLRQWGCDTRNRVRDIVFQVMGE